jgi:hypothetical protein
LVSAYSCLELITVKDLHPFLGDDLVETFTEGLHLFLNAQERNKVALFLDEICFVGIGYTDTLATRDKLYGVASIL